MEPATNSLRAKIRNVFATYGCTWLWVSFIVLLLGAFAGNASLHIPLLSVLCSQPDLLPAPVLKLVLASPGVAVFMALVFAPLIEEVLFRMLPLTLALVLARLLPARYRETLGKNLVTAVLIGVCCVVFGLAHGSPVNILIQGFVGLMLGRLFLKNGPSLFWAYFSCVFVHAAYNFTVITASLFT